MLTPKTNSQTYWQRKFHTWWVEPSSVFVQHHERFTVFMQPSQQFSFWSDQEAVRHVKESSRKQPERGIGSGKAEACEYEPLEHEENSFARGKPSPQLEHSPRGPLTMARQCILKRSNNTMLKPQTPGNRGRRDESAQPPAGKSLRKGWGPSLRKAEARIHQNADLQWRVLGESLQEHIKGESCRRCTISGDPNTQNQHIDLVNVYVGINEGSDSYGTRLYWDLGSLQEHELRRASEFVRHHPEVGTQARRDSECENGWMCISFMIEILAGSGSSNQVGQRQKYEFIQIQSYGWEKWRILQMHIEDGKVEWKNFNKLILTENNLELMENPLSSSGIFSQD